MQVYKWTRSSMYMDPTLETYFSEVIELTDQSLSRHKPIYCFNYSSLVNVTNKMAHCNVTNRTKKSVIKRKQKRVEIFYCLHGGPGINVSILMKLERKVHAIQGESKRMGPYFWNFFFGY